MDIGFNPLLAIFYFAYIFLVLSAVVHMLYQKRSPQNLTVWLLTLLLLPYLGILLYLIFGSRKLLYKRNKPNIVIPIKPRDSLVIPAENPLARQVDQLLVADQIACTTGGNQVELLDDSSQAFEAFMQALQKAQSRIHIETYIFELDVTGERILHALTEKARQGVEVRLLLDAVGSFALYRRPKALRPLLAAGGQVAFFQPVFKNFFNSQVNLRNHRKIYLFDDALGFTGGMNLSNDYLGSESDKPKNGRWKDLLFQMQGPVLSHYHIVFNEDWRYSTQESLPQIEIREISTTEKLVQTIPSGPDIHKEPLFESLMQAVYAARQEIVIVSPYFIPEGSIMTALMIAMKRGVKVILVSPEKSDHLIFDLGRSSYLRELHEAGGEIHFYTGKMLHAKLVFIDREAMLFGTANLDYRSLFINHELTSWVYDPLLIKQAGQWVEEVVAESQHYQVPDTRGRRLFENFTRIFAPIL
ncbi:cardiolipin synthase [Thiomicrorhabdus xiamenensis]|uniref:Cardiolipin synthase n=1 Tax=Thiomicrorhabdus xiamenensis TaxID=2739063 RepID=A0A7D4P5C1_9GAMM|nr:cardiolipin synthase [Thiomicrorhabdus xiamenensis]QKI89796.1 cardiolipin synthase [Thiomicrorhabdus xiamenensis]